MNKYRQHLWHWQSYILQSLRTYPDAASCNGFITSPFDFRMTANFGKLVFSTTRTFGTYVNCRRMTRGHPKNRLHGTHAQLENEDYRYFIPLVLMTDNNFIIFRTAVRLQHPISTICCLHIALAIFLDWLNEMQSWVTFHRNGPSVRRSAQFVDWFNEVHRGVALHQNSLSTGKAHYAWTGSTIFRQGRISWHGPFDQA